MSIWALLLASEVGAAWTEPSSLRAGLMQGSTSE